MNVEEKAKLMEAHDHPQIAAQQPALIGQIVRDELKADPKGYSAEVTKTRIGQVANCLRGMRTTAANKLKSGTSDEVFQHNLKVELAAGKKQKQALAIAYAKKRESGWKGKKP